MGKLKKIGCGLLAALTLLTGTVTAVSCGGSGGGETSSSVSSSVEEKVSISLSKKIYNIYDEETVALQVNFSINDEEADCALLNFSSSEPNIATVSDDGVVTGVSEGRAHITISYGSKSTVATINVTKRIYTITLSDDNVILPADGTQQITAAVVFGEETLQDPVLSWQSSNAAVATVENGLITAVGLGKATLSVSYKDTTVEIPVSVVAETTAENVNSFDEAYINIYGRSYINGGALNLDHAANGVEVGIIGTSLSLSLYSGTTNSYMRVFVDGETTGEKISVKAGTNTYTVASELDEGYHLIRIVKATEEQHSTWDVKSFTADKFFAVPEKSDFKIEFVGDSITAGYGLYGVPGETYTVDNSDCAATYAYIAANLLDADYSVVAFSGICAKAYHWCSNINMTTLYDRTSNSNTQAYTQTVDADVVVVNLGTNEASYLGDGYGGSGYATQLPTDYLELLEKVRTKNPDAYIICLYGMMGKDYRVETGIKSAVAAMDEKVVYNPFTFAPSVAGANGHPTAAAQQEWGEALAAYIQTLA